MGGIAGYMGNQQLDPIRVQRCLTVMQRRGPDASAHGHWVNSARQHVHLLSSRRRVIDLEPRADQPFQVGSRWLVYNGEVFNYLEVRQKLAALGHAFTTASDTEVLLRALDHFGWQVLAECEGMWAFALYDAADGSLLLSRDRFGEKPLFIYRDGSGVYFGSEVKFIVALLGRSFAANVTHLYRYLVNGYKALHKEGDTFFEGVGELRPASVLRLDALGVPSEAVAYWTPAYRPEETMPYSDAVAGVRERLICSTTLRLRADVPVAFCMSGGVDSNALLSIAKKVCGYDVHAFTIVNSAALREEQGNLVTYAARELGIRHTTIPVSTDGFLAKMRTLVQYHDAPVYTITSFAHWLLMETVAQHGYRVSVGGTGADELFTGYYDHHLAYLYQVRQFADRHASARREWLTQNPPGVANRYLGNPDLFIQDPTFRGHIFFNAAEFSPFLTRSWFEPFAERSFTEDLLRNRMLNELCHETVPVILHEEDLNAMYFSIENRSPFLDRDLCRFCYQIPTIHLIRDGYAKAVLREAMRGIVPERVLTSRRKESFNAPVFAPIFSFLDVRHPEVRSYLLDGSPIFDHVRRDKIEGLLAKQSLSYSESRFLFCFISSKMFLEVCGGP